jgi:hypothetical protein
MAAVVGAVQWAERRPDTTLIGRALRWLARLLMLGLRPAEAARRYLPAKT